MTKIKEDLLNIFQAAINAVAGDQVVKKEVTGEKYLDKYHIIAIGKAADAMLQGLPDEKIIDGLLISKHGHISDKLQHDSRFICIESDHPIPKNASILAGKTLLDYIDKLPPNAPCLFLISGGASALVEVLQDNWSLEDLADMTDYLLANAYSINEINAIRRKTSKIKGGGLWHYLNHRPVTCLLISDVPNDSPQDIGSGLLFPASIDSLTALPPNLPKKWSSKIKKNKSVQTPKNFDWKIIASLSNAKQAAADHAKKLGYSVTVVSDFLDGKAVDVARDCVEMINRNPQTLFIWGGETTVILPKNAGKGGRNQHLALASAIQMDKLSDCYLLTAGTDGSDGLSTATGALVDSLTLARGHKLNLNAADFLQNADSNTFFSKINEVIMTGATGTNVMDLVFAIKEK